MEERLWGTLPATDTISIDGDDLATGRLDMSWLVLAAYHPASADSNESPYFAGGACCGTGETLSSDDAWTRQFRQNVAQRKPATMQVELKAGSVTVPDVQLQFTGPGYSWQGFSREWPRNVTLPPGDYAVTIGSPRFTTAAASQKVTVVPGSCARLWVNAEPVSSISGTVADVHGWTGQKLSYILEGEFEPESLSPWDSALASARRRWQQFAGWGEPPAHHTYYFVNPDAAGRFEVHVLPGKYRLTVQSGDSQSYVFPPPIPKTYYPGVIDKSRATEIVVPTNGAVTNIHFQLPDYGPTRQVEVLLLKADGSPAPNKVVAHVGTFPGERDRTAGWTQKLTDVSGRATFAVWQSLDYDLKIFESVHEDDMHIPAGSGSVGVKFVINP